MRKMRVITGALVRHQTNHRGGTIRIKIGPTEETVTVTEEIEMATGELAVTVQIIEITIEHRELNQDLSPVEPSRETPEIKNLTKISTVLLDNIKTEISSITILRGNTKTTDPLTITDRGCCRGRVYPRL